MLLGSTMGLLEGLSEFSWVVEGLEIYADRVIQLPRLFSRVWHSTREVVTGCLSFCCVWVIQCSTNGLSVRSPIAV
jgi:hypothetical protein